MAAEMIGLILKYLIRKIDEASKDMYNIEIGGKSNTQHYKDYNCSEYTYNQIIHDFCYELHEKIVNFSEEDFF